jgi:16S rRNA (cytosine1402-N4)-methyltransferase
MTSYNYHQPVLLQDCINGLNIQENGIYADVTFGGGGHSKEILKHLGPEGKLFVFDQDPDAKKNLWDDKRLIFIQQNFRHLKNFMRLHGVKSLNGILADLGVSSHQFDAAERGFSIRFEGNLDMRMNKSEKVSADVLLNNYEEGKLAEIFRNYGELKEAKRLARTIANYRSEKQIETTEELKLLVKPIIPSFEKESKYLARVFQAIRIAVNDEIDALREFLEQSAEVLQPGGRLVIISYHSLEDRLVKNIVKTGNTEGEIKKDFFGNIFRPFIQITKKPIEPSETEILKNNRARSAKLRIAEKK